MKIMIAQKIYLVHNESYVSTLWKWKIKKIECKGVFEIWIIEVFS